MNAEIATSSDVERPVMVGVLGTHSTGQSTFVARLAHELRRLHVQVAMVGYRDEQADPTELAYLESLVRGHSARYDLLFRTTLDPSIPLGANKFRDSDHDFRSLADRHVSLVLHELDLPHEQLPADGHDQALDRALRFMAARLAGLPAG